MVSGGCSKEMATGVAPTIGMTALSGTTKKSAPVRARMYSGRINGMLSSDLLAASAVPPQNHSLLAVKNAAANLFADLFFTQSDERPELRQCWHSSSPKSQPRLHRIVDEFSSNRSKSLRLLISKR
jgi:hypothetical protein